MSLPYSRAWIFEEPTLATSSYEGIVGDNIWLYVVSVHLIEEVQGKLISARLLAGSNQAAVGDDIPFASPSHHVLENCHRLFNLYMKGIIPELTVS